MYKRQVINSRYDKINKADNEKLYNILLNKVCDSIYRVAYENQKEVIQNGLDRFLFMDLEEQCNVLINMLSIFNTSRATGCDLSAIKGSKQAAVYTLSSKLSNWNKNFESVRIINESPSGIFRTESDNILEWL